MKTVTKLCATVLLAAAALSAGPAPKVTETQFLARFVMTGPKDGKPTVLAQPMLITTDGQEADFLAGGEVPVDVGGAEPEHFSCGVGARLKVHTLAPDRLRVSVRFRFSDLDAQHQGDVVIRESAVRCVKSVRPGEPFEVDLGGGRKVKTTVNAITPAPPAK
jgi:Flp pilus assembly secretin CpaC